MKVLTRIKEMRTSKGMVAVHVTGTVKVPLILIHGNSSSAASFSQLVGAEETFKHFICYCIELPGHGLSDQWSSNDYNLEDLSKIVVEVIKSLKIEGVEILGHSVGGHIAIRVADQIHPKKLYLVQCSPGEDLGVVASYFQPLPESQYLYAEEVSKEQAKALMEALTNSSEESLELSEIFFKTDPHFRGGLGLSLGSKPFVNEIEILNKLKTFQVQTYLLSSPRDQFLRTDNLKQNWSDSKLLNFIETEANSHYAHRISFSLWFQSFKKLMDK